MGESTISTVDRQALQAEIASLKAQLEEARDQAELNLLQLKQVQDELEYYFLSHQEYQMQLKQHQHEERRAEVLIAALLERIEAAKG
jgi:flagellin-like hook-associated protein FlgL